MALRYLLACVLVAAAAATDVSQCPGKSVENLTSDVKLEKCAAPPCRLKKGTNQAITVSFTPDKDMSDIRNHVTAEVFGVKLPFVGVDGASICGKLETESGEKASCPLKAGTRYLYRDAFPVLKVYPTLSTKVHWALQHNNKDVVCFEVPARIS
ncbi:ecdysteroid-regulated 16 kDa protein [Plutella xylostella]|uniref:ecdysteroid-regulated 16 kDa protein n=1 Tax=Plutella xylostella TaxID=51655 RepID=UPI00203239A5|nr:ecdysteroid-regulated 16 kDa protein [Plutella xylostella]